MAHRKSIRERSVVLGLLLLLAVAAVPWGGNRPAAMYFYGLWLAALTLLSLVSPLSDRRSLPLWPVCFGLLYLIWLLLQALPMPFNWLQLLAPEVAAIHAAVPSSGWNSISLSPGTTVSGIFLSLAFAQVYWLASRHINGHRRIRALLWVITIAAAAEATYGAVMTLSGIEWGVLEPKLYGRGVATGTFVNRNHLAGYLCLGLACGIGLILSEPPNHGGSNWRSRLRNGLTLLLGPKLLLRTLLAVMVIALVLTRSRMGNIAFTVALTTSGLVWLLLRPGGNKKTAVLFFVSLIAVDMLIVSRYFGLEALAKRIQQTELQQEARILVFEDLLPVIREYGLQGAGYGAFPDAFAAQQTAQVRGRYDHAHNDYAEFAIELGVIGVLPLAFFAAWHLLMCWQLIRNPDSSRRAGLAFTLFFAMTALAVHGLADFDLRIPAIPLTLMALLGSLAGLAEIRPRSSSAQA